MAVDVLNEDIRVKKKLDEAVVRILNVRQENSVSDSDQIAPLGDLSKPANTLIEKIADAIGASSSLTKYGGSPAPRLMQR